MAQDVGEGGLEVAVDLDLRDLNVGAVCTPDEVLRRASTALDNFLRVASQKNLPHSLLVMQLLGVGEMPWGIERLGECQMLFCNDASRDALLALAVIVPREAASYRSQHGGHELVRLLWLHEAAHLEHANGKAGYYRRVLRQRLLQHLAVFLVVLEGANFRHASKALKRAQVGLVDMGEVGIGYYHVWQRLDVAQPVCKPTWLAIQSVQTSR